MPNPTPKVSIVIPAYNHERFVEEAVRSSLAQDIDSLEVVVVDDASTDGTADVIRSITDPRLRFLPQASNGGISVAANIAIEAARGEFIAVLGSDDVMKPGRIAAQLAAFEADASLGAVFTLVETIGEDGQVVDHDLNYAQENRSREKWLRWLFLKGNSLFAPAAMMRASAVRDIEFDPRLLQLQDFDYWVRLALAGHSMYIVEEKLTSYRWSPQGDNTSAPKPERQARVQFERIMVLYRYLGIGSAAEFSAIFPDLQITGDLHDHLVPFYVAMRALQGKQGPDLREFGLRALYDFMGDEAHVDAVAEAHGFQMSDLFRLTGTSPLGHLSRGDAAEGFKHDQARRDAEAELKKARKEIGKLEQKIAKMKSASVWQRLRGW